MASDTMGNHPFAVELYDSDEGGMFKTFTSGEGDHWHRHPGALTISREADSAGEMGKKATVTTYPDHAWFGLRRIVNLT